VEATEGDDDVEEVETSAVGSGAEALLDRSATGSTVFDHIQPQRTTSIARLEGEDAKTRQLEQEVSSNPGHQPHLTLA